MLCPSSEALLCEKLLFSVALILSSTSNVHFYSVKGLGFLISHSSQNKKLFNFYLVEIAVKFSMQTSGE